MSQYMHALDVANKQVRPVNVDSNGNLQVDIVSSSAGGDATAANQVTNHNKLDSAITKLTEIDTALDDIKSGTGGTGNLEGIRQAILSDLQGKMDHISDDLDTLDGSVNTIEACVASNELAVSHAALTELGGAINSSRLDVSHGALTELEAAINSSKLDVNVASDISHFSDGDAISASSKGQLVMGRDNSNNAHPLHLTANGDLEVEIADFTKGQDLMSASFPVVIASDQSALSVSSSVTRNQITVASGASLTAGSNTSEIDMDGYKHLHVYGTSSVNFGSLCVVNRQSSGGTDYLDGQKIFSASDPSGGSTYYFSFTLENVGARYIAFRNLDSGAQVVTLYAEQLK